MASSLFVEAATDGGYDLGAFSGIFSRFVLPGFLIVPQSPITASQFERELWDVIVIGTGMGGATLGHALAQAGRRVLFVEKGHSNLDLADDSIRDRLPDDRRDFFRLNEEERAHAFGTGWSLDRRRRRS